MIHTEDFEKMGETAVRNAVIEGRFGGRKSEQAQKWLDEKDRQCTVRLAQQANKTSARALIVSIFALGVAFVAAIAAFR